MSEAEPPRAPPGRGLPVVTPESELTPHRGRRYACPRGARSSAGQSSGLKIRWSLVRIQAGPLRKALETALSIRGRGNEEPALKPDPRKARQLKDSGRPAGWENFPGEIVYETAYFWHGEDLGIIAGVWYLGYATQQGRPKSGALTRDAINDAVLSMQAEVYVDSVEEVREIQRAAAKVSWKKHRAELAGRAIALGLVNVAKVAELYEVDRSTADRWKRKSSVQAWLEKT
jgi:hypothetical protein